MLNALLYAAALTSTAGAASAAADVQWSASSQHYVSGSAYEVALAFEVPDGGSTVPGWLLTPAAFTIDGKPLAKRDGGAKIPLAGGSKLEWTIDLAPAIQASGKAGGSGFQLGFADDFSTADAVAVKVCALAPEGLDFLEMSAGELVKYNVLMSTNRGDMVMEFWPDAALEHVRNFLDLSYTGFYDGAIFHRVIPGFMIQGGCKPDNVNCNGPRTLKAEFSKDPKFKHLAGVLSMARTPDPNSASCQFFVMHDTAPHLDGQYSSFGQLVEGLEVVEKIVTSPRAPSDRPREQQSIHFARVILAQ